MFFTRLPRQTFDPQRMVIDDIFPCEGGHAQERSLLHQVLPNLQPLDLVIDDRNFCTVASLTGMARRKVRFIARQHGRMPYRLRGKLRFVGRCPTGRVYEQALVIRDPETGQELTVRRVTLRLKNRLGVATPKSTVDQLAGEETVSSFYLLAYVAHLLEN